MLGMSSSQLTFIFFRGVGQPPTRLSCNMFYKLFVFLWISNNLHKMWIWSNNNEKPHEASSHYNPSGGYREKWDGSRMFPWVFLTAHDHRWPSYDPRWSWADSTDMASFEVLRLGIYPLVNVYATMENHHVSWENSLFLWPFSVADFDITRGYLVELVSKTRGVGWDPNVAFGFVWVVTPLTSTPAAGQVAVWTDPKPRSSKVLGPFRVDRSRSGDGGTVVIFSWRYEAIKITKT